MLCRKQGEYQTSHILIRCQHRIWRKRHQQKFILLPEAEMVVARKLNSWGKPPRFGPCFPRQPILEFRFLARPNLDSVCPWLRRVHAMGLAGVGVLRKDGREMLVLFFGTEDVLTCGCVFLGLPLGFPLKPRKGVPSTEKMAGPMCQHFPLRGRNRVQDHPMIQITRPACNSTRGAQPTFLGVDSNSVLLKNRLVPLKLIVFWKDPDGFRMEMEVSPRFLQTSDVGRLGRSTRGGFLSTAPTTRTCRKSADEKMDLAMGHNLWLHSGVDEHPFTTYFDVHQGYGVLTHIHLVQKQIKTRGPVRPSV